MNPFVAFTRHAAESAISRGGMTFSDLQFFWFNANSVESEPSTSFNIL
jgi:hypothetical protein